MVEEKNKKWERNKQKKQRKILESFIELYNDEDYEEISIRKIAKRSNVSVGTIYRYYKDGKLSILRKFFEETSRNVLDESAFKVIPQGDLKKLIQLYISNHIKTHRNNIHIHRVLYQAAVSDKIKNLSAKDILYPMLNKSLKTIKNALSLQNISDEEFNKTFTVIFNLVESVIHRHVYIMPMFDTDEELIDFLLDHVLFILNDKYKLLKKG